MKLVGGNLVGQHDRGSLTFKYCVSRISKELASSNSHSNDNFIESNCNEVLIFTL